MTTPLTDTTTIALVTGATQGIGRETVRRLAALGWTVWLGARDLQKGAEIAAATEGDVRVVELDVLDDASVAAAAATVEQVSGRLDVLVNNAGVAGGSEVTPRDTVAAHFLPVYGVNVLGPVRTTHAFLPLLDRSSQPRIVMVSSGLGSLAITTDPDRFESTLHSLTYPSSKSALNMITTQYAKALPGYQVNAVDPGYTSTGLNGFSGPQSVEQGAESTVRAATLEPGAPSGTFTDAAGVLPW
ncbi:SDR family NAD(P)-dependent oxidoreductase [Cellulomonas sp. URHE0023]|uniref:SDR family NAD(P)-dependent oxidoreductase n=1 Tax=Cellulomonas sp. URHE0023 TaxID=1380354 RepID=UPI00054CF723|nr:SDR family NAD(P)-dependent oxidoreductase [Cellulomonas sp. URHE0023]